MSLSIHQSLKTLDGFTRSPDGARHTVSVPVGTNDYHELGEDSEVTKLAKPTFHLVREEFGKFRSYATGFFISSDGLGVVAKHSVDYAYKFNEDFGFEANVVECEQSRSIRDPLQIIAVSDSDDVALVKAVGKSSPHHYLALNPNRVKLDDEVYKCGFSEAGSKENILDSEKRVAHGRVLVENLNREDLIRNIYEVTGKTISEETMSIIERIRRSVWGGFVLLDNDQIKGGYSGCPVVDKSLSVRGVQSHELGLMPVPYKDIYAPGVERRFVESLYDPNRTSYARVCKAQHIVDLLESLNIDYKALAAGEPAFK